MEAIQNLGIFAGQAFIILLVIGALLILIALLVSKSQVKSELEIELLHEKNQTLANRLKENVLNKEEIKKYKKSLKKSEKKNSDLKKSCIYVLDFHGDMKASAVESLREEITAILNVATKEDEVVVKVESPGGMVHTYGLAASQLLRIRERQIPLTVSVDKVAASGGYMVACTANQILCAPFAIIGSIGVVAQVPNFHKLLSKHDIDYKEYTAGEFKRTVSLLGEITPKAEEKFKEQIENTHSLFKYFVHAYRPQIDLAQVATGEYWYGQQAKDLKLVDTIQTSDDYILSKCETHQVIKVKYNHKQKLSEKLSQVMGSAFESSFTKVLTQLESRKWI